MQNVGLGHGPWETNHRSGALTAAVSHGRSFAILPACRAQRVVELGLERLEAGSPAAWLPTTSPPATQG